MAALSRGKISHTRPSEWSVLVLPQKNTPFLFLRWRPSMNHSMRVDAAPVVAIYIRREPLRPSFSSRVLIFFPPLTLQRTDTSP